MIHLKKAKVVRETEKALLLSFEGVNKPADKIAQEWNQDFSPIEMWFPKSFIKIENALYFVKESQNFGLKFQVELAAKMIDQKHTDEKVNGVDLAGINCKINRNVGKLWFNSESFAFSVGMAEKQPTGYYESHRYAKGQSNFGKTFFIDGLKEEQKELLNALMSYLLKAYHDSGYGHKFLLKSEQLKEDGKNKWIDLGTWA
jgi:hypothetical protein